MSKLFLFTLISEYGMFSPQFGVILLILTFLIRFACRGIDLGVRLDSSRNSVLRSVFKSCFLISNGKEYSFSKMLGILEEII